MIPPAGAVARSRNLGQTFLANCVHIVFIPEIVTRMKTSVGWSHSHGELILFGIITRATTDPPAAFVPVFQYEMMSDSLRILSLSFWVPWGCALFTCLMRC